jgi:hypothetical protein
VAVSLLVEEGEVIAVLGIAKDLPALAVGAWVWMTETRLGAYISTRIEFVEPFTSERDELELNRWYELLSSPAELSVSVAAVPGGWIICIEGAKHYFLKAQTMKLKDDSDHLIYFAKDKEAITFSISDGHTKYMAMSIAFIPCNLNVCLGESVATK